tara:strand:- start:395 stop:925 length:531 start_codon:yes stop_codon:yes gene_type:complete
MINLKKPVLTTPVGNAIHPWVSNADVQFHPEGKFHTKLECEQNECAKIIKAISDEIEAKSNEQQKLDANKKITYANKPYEITADGKCVFKLQTKFRPTILDNKLKPLADDVKIFGGSKLRITFEAFGYNMPVGIGCSLRMKQVQVLELVTGTLGDALGDLKVEPDVQPKIKQEISL